MTCLHSRESLKLLEGSTEGRPRAAPEARGRRGNRWLATAGQSPFLSLPDAFTLRGPLDLLKVQDHNQEILPSSRLITEMLSPAHFESMKFVPLPKV